eukprot:3228798-Rhodomonas_salina.1
MEGRVQQLEEEAARQRAEIDRLKGLEEQLRAEKERNLANQIQIQSWQVYAPCFLSLALSSLPPFSLALPSLHACVSLSVFSLPPFRALLASLLFLFL